MVRLVLYSINSNLQLKQNNGHREHSEAISLSHGLWFNKLTNSGLTSMTPIPAIYPDYSHSETEQNPFVILKD